MASATLQILVGILSAALVAALSLRKGLLSPSGALAAFLLGGTVFALGGMPWALPLLAFFLPSSSLSRVGPWRRKGNVLEDGYQKGSRRDAWQVTANGGVAGVLAVMYGLSSDPTLFVFFTASLAAAAADTWATEIGGGIGGRTVSVTTWRQVAPGTSGGVSLVGMLGGLTGSIVVGVSALPWFSSPAYDLFIVVIAGFAGMLVDSLVGATLQQRYRCGVCRIITERTDHCGISTDRYRGIRFIDNDIVNLICSLAAAALAILLRR